MKKKKLEIEIKKANVFELKPEGKYLLILPKDAKVKEISSAIGRFFEPAKVFVLAVNNVTEIKIAELLEEEKRTN